MPENATVDSPSPRPWARGLDLAALAATGMEGDGAPPPPAIPGYQIESLLGTGGLGHVWKAARLEDGATVALKIPHASDASFTERLQVEAESLRALDHPHILRCLSHGTRPDGHPWLALEYVDGAPLSVLIPSNGFAWEEALRHFRAIAAAVIHAHEQGVLHRDLKPSNVLVGHDGSLKVADFGLARPVQERVVSFSLTLSGHVAGTAEYLAPECYTRDYRPAAAADIYALGVILYELLAGHPPRGAWQPVSHQKKVDVRVDDVLRRALDPNSADRFPTARSMLTELERIARTPPRYAGTPRLTRAVRVMDAAWTILGLFILLGAFGIVSRIELFGFALPVDLVGTNTIRIGAYQGLLLLLVLTVPMGLWQLVRLWRFRAIPLREALPSPFGLRLGTSRTAVLLVLLNQVLCVLLPVYLFHSIWQGACAIWLTRQDGPWVPGLVVTQGFPSTVAVDPWQWPEPGKSYSLQERVGWLDDPLGRYFDNTDYYPGYVPRIMAGCALFFLGAIVITAISALARWWRFRKWGRAILFLAVAGYGLRASDLNWREWQDYSPPFRSGQDFPAWHESDSLVRSKIGINAHIYSIHRLHPLLFPGPPAAWEAPPPELLRCYADPIDMDEAAPLDRTQTIRWLTAFAAQSRAAQRRTERLRYHVDTSRPHKRDLEGHCLYADTTDPATGPATGALTLLFFSGDIIRGQGVGISTQHITSLPLWSVEPRALPAADGEAWARAFLEGLNSPSSVQPDPLAPLFLPRLMQNGALFNHNPDPVITPLLRENLFASLRELTARGARPLLLHPPGAATKATGGRQRLLLDIEDRGNHSTWTADLVFMEGRWQCARLAF